MFTSGGYVCNSTAFPQRINRIWYDAERSDDSIFVKNAEGYWRGEPYASDTTWEILFVGELKVIWRFDTVETFREAVEDNG